jgi:molybdate/tungstate transport system substrate-binding protein
LTSTRKRLTLLAVLVLALHPRAWAAEATPIVVAYAGSMGAVMDQKIGPAFARTHNAEYRGIGQASYALAHLLASGQLQADVFVSVTPGPMRILLKAGVVKQAIPVAGTQMALAYSPQSSFAKDFAATRDGKRKWHEVLESPGLRFGRTDPATDPQGRNVVFTLLLAQNYYHVTDLNQKILGSIRNESQIFAEPSLLTRLTTGQIDATIGYLSAIRSQHLPAIELPREINLSDPAFFDSYYDRVSLSLPAPPGGTTVVKPEPLVFYAATLKGSAHPALADQFVAFLGGLEGQQLFQASGYDPAVGGPLR